MYLCLGLTHTQLHTHLKVRVHDRTDKVETHLSQDQVAGHCGKEGNQAELMRMHAHGGAALWQQLDGAGKPMILMIEFTTLQQCTRNTA
jgi:hypothetical protein